MVKYTCQSFKTFVANRVAKVQELTEGFQWNHVPSILNPADLVSRDCALVTFQNLRLWWHGPQFLEKVMELLRVGGRLSNSDLPYVNKHPAILPGNHNLTVQIIVHFHEKESAYWCFFSYTLCANKELKRFLKLIEDSDDNLAGFLSAEGIEWKFIPPRAPSFGGLWEASVKSIKYHLRRVVSGSNLTYEEFLTVCIK
ncbi:uncharacterized protein TNCV_1306481 [Trichonephila clavipes]|nr:uncharacterized protein TNCV_1306481 [Trichonephila clavipes]